MIEFSVIFERHSVEIGKDRTEKQTMTFDEMSADKSKSFVAALQELKNLRPQLYSAAEYCEKSYLNSEQKQMFLDNLKDYAVRALVNAIDHLGTVAYKLSDIVDQQTLEISSVDLKVTRANQKLLTCQTYTDKEGLRQQQLLAIIPKHHKHYILPNSVKVHFSSHIEADPKQSIVVRGRLYPSGAAAAKTLSWHLASATKSTMKGSSFGIMSTEKAKMSGRNSPAFNSLDGQKSKRMKSAPATRAAMQTLGVTRRDHHPEGLKPLTPHRSFDNPVQKEMVHPPLRSKSMLSVRQATPEGERKKLTHSLNV